MSASAPNLFFFVDQPRCDIRQVSGCVRVTREGEAGREQESARTGEGNLDRITSSLEQCRLSPVKALPHLLVNTQSLPLLLISPNLVVSQVPSLTHRPRSLFHTLPSYLVRQKLASSNAFLNSRLPSVANPPSTQMPPVARAFCINLNPSSPE